MNCKKCGSPLEPNSVSCSNCGATVDVLIPGTPGVTPVSSAESIPAPAVNPTPEAPAPVAPAVDVPAAPVPPAAPVAPAATPAAVPPTPVAPAATPAAVPPTPMQQPMMNPAMPGQPMPANNGGKSKTLIIAVVAVVAIAVVALVLYFTVFNKKSDNKKNSNSNSASNTSENTGSNSASNVSNTNTNNNPTPSSNSFTMNHGGFTFQIPMQYQAAVQDGWLTLTDNQTWLAALMPIASSYDSLSATQVQANLGSQYSNVVAEEGQIGGRNYIIARITEGENSMVVAYTKANSLYTFAIMVLESPSVIDTLNIMDGIIGTAKSNNNGFGMDKSEFNTLDALING